MLTQNDAVLFSPPKPLPNNNQSLIIIPPSPSFKPDVKHQSSPKAPKTAEPNPKTIETKSRYNTSSPSPFAHHMARPAKTLPVQKSNNSNMKKEKKPFTMDSQETEEDENATQEMEEEDKNLAFQNLLKRSHRYTIPLSSQTQL